MFKFKWSPQKIEGTFNLNLTDVRINTTAGEIPVDVYNGTVKILAFGRPVPALCMPASITASHRHTVGHNCD